MKESVLVNIKQKVTILPNEPGVYLMKDMHGNIIYIGKAKNLKNRVSSYFVNTYKPYKVRQMVAKIFAFDFIITKSEYDALNLESNLIRQHQPYYNILLKTSKGHTFLKITIKEEYPKLEVTRKIKKDGAKYFGPYFAGITAHELVQIISNTFMLRDFEDANSDRPYAREELNYFLGKGGKEVLKRINKNDYQEEVNKIIAFLNGDLSYVKSITQEKMKINAKMLNFERAIELRNSLNIIEKLNQKVITELKTNINVDIIGAYETEESTVLSVHTIRGGKMVGGSNYHLSDASNNLKETINNFLLQYYQKDAVVPKEIITDYELDDTLIKWLSNESEIKVLNVIPQKGTKRHLLDNANLNAKDYLLNNVMKLQQQFNRTMGALSDLQKDLSLSKLPVRIECYDISNIQGSFIVASMVVFINGIAFKNHYRKFKIESVIGENNDFLSMQEVLERRFKRLSDKDVSFKNKPDLIVIDGGKGQLGIAKKVAESFSLKTDIISLAEKHDEIFLLNKTESVYLSRDNEGLRLLQRVRDEAHRFALAYHRSLRNKGAIESQLDNIPGVGPVTVKKLIVHFKDIDAIKKATVKELTKVPGVTKLMANNINLHFKKD